MRELPAGGFRLHCNRGVCLRVEAADAEGGQYANDLLAALRAADRVPPEPCVLEDAPAFARRGFMLDISRDRVPTMDWTKWLVERLAKLRYNELQLYTEHTFAYAAHRAVWEHASPFTAEEIRELDDFCRARHIELVPNQNTFGHMERWLKHGSYRPLAECPDGFAHPESGEHYPPMTLHPDEASLSLVAGLLDELLPCFRSGRVNVGGDEPWELGLGRSRERARVEGKHRAYLDYMKRVFALAEAHGRAPQFWADIVLEKPELVAELPGNAIPAIWGYESDHPFDTQCAEVARAGFAGRFSVVPGTSTWNSFAGRLDNAARNIEAAATAGRAHGADGLLLTAWGDLGHHAPYATLYPPLILGAQHAWGTPALDHRPGATHAPPPLAEAVDAVFFDEMPPGNGALLCALSDLEESLPAPPKTGLPHLLTVRRNFLTETALEQVREDQLEAVLRRLEALAERFGPETEDDVRTTWSLLSWATAEALGLKSGERPEGEENPAAIVRERFRKNWLRHSRPGGLGDSAARIRDVFPSAANRSRTPT